jgi:hypothetical protein
MLHAEPGKQTVLDRLLDVLAVLGIRVGLTLWVPIKGRADCSGGTPHAWSGFR